MFVENLLCFIGCPALPHPKHGHVSPTGPVVVGSSVRIVATRNLISLVNRSEIVPNAKRGQEQTRFVVVSLIVSTEISVLIAVIIIMMKNKKNSEKKNNDYDDEIHNDWCIFDLCQSPTDVFFSCSVLATVFSSCLADFK